MKYETQLFGGQTNLHCMKQILHMQNQTRMAVSDLPFVLPLRLP